MANIAFEKEFSASHAAPRRQPVLSLAGFTKTVPVWLDRVRQRRRLSQLDDHFLRDIGLTRAQAQEEARKPFWMS